MITKDNKTKAIKKLARSKNFMAKRGLIQMVGKRKKLLKYLERTDFELYKKTITKLGLRK